MHLGSREELLKTNFLLFHRILQSVWMWSLVSLKPVVDVILKSVWMWSFVSLKPVVDVTGDLKVMKKTLN